MQSLSLSHPHIVRPFQFHSCIRKERIPWQTPRRHALKSQSLRWHYPNQVRSKIYLPLSLSHKLPLALFFSVFQYSTHLSRCQTSTAYCSLHSRRRRYCSLRSQQHASRCTEFMLHCFRQPFRLHKEEFVSYSGFSILSMRYPIPMCVWIYCTPFFSGSSFFRSVAIKTLREATSFSEQRPQIC